MDDAIITRKNVDKVLGLLKDYMGLEEELKDLESKIQNKQELFHVYKKIKVMTYIRMSLESKLQKQSNKNTQI